MPEATKQKEDARVRYTKMMIRNSFYELLTQHPLDKITVTAICKEANINRATFYKHYMDVYDLADRLQEDAIIEFKKNLEKANNEQSAEELIVEILEFMKSEKTRNLMSLKNDSSSFFSKNVSIMIYQNFSVFLEKRVNKNAKTSTAQLFSYISGGARGILDYWIGNDFNDDTKVIANQIIYLSKATIDGLN